MTEPLLPAAQTPRDLDFISHSQAQTERIGMRLGQLLRAGDLVLLSGPLGAGKTHLIKGIARGLGYDGPVTSPTFVLINEYHADDAHGRLPIYHVDLYRVSGVTELATIGLEEIWLADGVCLVEWPERAAAALPPENLQIALSYVSETKRRLRLMPRGARYQALLATFKEATFG
ncbi:MAG: tRNA (adenosine(37)-N6)-threonylcarbamoyltransferase complex ATPase subunit type 1 TsaE [Chloroflexus sp.]|nr:tRNA (adenosine(37)-N6)-threonylcarbamoyltransferase complex ATPase subunit type 1 TsaE [Chloroflexus sp.]